MKEIIAYTDGSAVVNGKRKGNGGFGTFFPDFYGNPLAYSKGYRETKTGRMEITALLYAIKAFYYNHKKPIKLIVYSDSEYVVKSFTEKRLVKWIGNNWMSYGSEIKNVDLWKEVVKELKGRPFLHLTLRHIKSHQVEKEKDPVKRERLLKDIHIRGNMMADWLADYKRHKILE